MPPRSWFDTARPVDVVRVEQLVAAGAALDPDAPAVLDDVGENAPATVTTHAGLDAWARRVSTILRGCGVVPGEYVAVLAGHRARTVGALVGVLHAGAAYVPLDPRWPTARMVAVLEQAGCRTVLTDAAHAGRARTLADELLILAHVVLLDDEPTRTVPDPDDVEDLWDVVALDDDPHRAAGFNLRGPEVGPDEVARYVDRVVALADVRPGTSVLEVGCGTGLVTRRLAAAGAEVTGVDPSGVALRKLLAAMPDPLPGTVRTVQGSAEHLQYLMDDARYDVVVLASVVQFLGTFDALARCLAQVARLLRPGGRVVLADLVAPEHAAGSHLAVTRRDLGDPRLTARFRGLSMHRRDESFGPVLGHRYDVVMTAEGGGLPAPLHVVPAAEIRAAMPAPTAASSDPHAIAYAIFTSGTTGRPKGVMVSHASVANLVDWVNREFAVTAVDRLLFVTSFAFDLSVYDMFGTLAAGAALVTLDDARMVDPDELAEVMARRGVTFWDSAPAALGLVLESLAECERVVDGVQRVFLSGDWVPLPMVDAIRRRLPRAELVVLGGATEATVWSNSFRVEWLDPAWPSVPYGKPMQNARYHVLDDDLRPVPVGEPGNLHIAGSCVADGYLGDADLTAARFRDDPFTTGGDRMYDTGDRARWRTDGNLEFLGRRDAQVKVRGYRVELGDVRQGLLAHPEARDAAVVPYGPRGATALHGFWTGDVEASQMRRHLVEVLPPYCVPVRLTRLPTMPVNASGKVDLSTLTSLAEAAGA